MIYPDNWIDYELIDHGLGRKLERFGEVVLDRPEPSANWKKSKPANEWNRAEAVFTENKNQKGIWNKDLNDWNI